MRSSCRWALALAALALLPGGPAHAAKPAWPPIALASLTVTNLTGDPLVTSANTERLFRALLGRTEFEHLEAPAHSGDWEGYSVHNPLLGPPGTTGGDTLRLDVTLEIEQVSFGAPVVAWNPARPGGALFEVSQTNPAWVEGIVRHRLRIRWGSPPESIMVVAVGQRRERSADFGRRELLGRASRIAAWELCPQMVRELGRSLHLPVAKRHAEMKKDRYLDEVWNY